MKDKNSLKTTKKSDQSNNEKKAMSPGVKSAVVIISSIVAVLLIVGAVILYFNWRDHDVGRTYEGDLRERYDYNLKEYISVPKYDNIEVVLGNTDVTNEELQRHVLRDRAALYNDGWNEVRLTEKGDKVTVDFSVETEDGNNIMSKTADFIIGDNDVSSDIDVLLSGKSKGEHVSGKVTVSENGTELSEYAGEVVVFSADITAAYYLSDVSSDIVKKDSLVKFEYTLKENDGEEANVIEDKISSQLLFGEEKGKGALLGIEEHLEGVGRNESFKYETTLPNDYEKAEYAGKSVVVEVSVKEIETWEELLCRGCEQGDIVGLEYKILYEGKVVEENNKSRQNAVIGAEDVLPGFDSALVGLKVGDTVSKELSLAEPCYSFIEYSGKTVTVEAEITYIDAPIFAEYNDDWAVNFGQPDVDSYETMKMTQLTSNREKQIDAYIESRIIKEVVEAAEVKKIPEKEYDEIYNIIKSSDEAAAAQNSVSFDEYIKSEYGYTETEYEENLKSRVNDIIKNEMVYYYIARRERIALSDEEYEKRVLEYASEQDFSTVEEFEVYMENYSGYSKYNVHEMVWCDMTYEYLESKVIRK